MVSVDEHLAETDFERLRQLVHSETGIVLGPAKRLMLESRLRRRLRALEMSSFGEYCHFLFQQRGFQQEFSALIDAVSTNKTDFFRESNHFEFLTATVLPELARLGGAGFSRSLQVWSAACSSGEEPYTLAMVLSEYRRRLAAQDFRFSILATDVCGEVLDKARRGVYAESDIGPIPETLRRRYLLKSRDSESRLVRVAPELRGLVDFRRLNLMQETFGFRGQFDVIFCRNVFIYFDKQTQQNVARRLAECLPAGGYLFMGHSESLNGFAAPLIPVGTTVYRRRLDDAGMFHPSGVLAARATSLR